MGKGKMYRMYNQFISNLSIFNLTSYIMLNIILIYLGHFTSVRMVPTLTPIDFAPNFFFLFCLKITPNFLTRLNWT